jgi:hypothetical protein
LTDAGKLTLGVVWDGEAVSTTDIRSTRPMASLMLRDKAPEQVLHIVPLLFSVCGRAQGAAAGAALQAARQGVSAVSATVQRAIACESIQEHLWRVMLDWPKLLGLPRQEQRFAAWYALLRKIAAGELDMAAFRQELERDCLGMPVAAWRGMDSYSGLQTWWRKADRPVAQLLAQLAELGRGAHAASESRLLPAWSAAEAGQACAGRWDVNFSVRPDWLGEAAETGAWAYYADNPLLRDVWQQSGSKALTRLLARILDVVEMASGDAAPRLDVASPETGEAIAVARTARGLLMHHVRLVAEQVTEYEIVAPTEWNFHLAGAFAQDMRGMVERDMGRLQQSAQVVALSLDPCVAYDIEVRHA